MEAYKLQIIETVVALIAFALMRYLTQTVINNTLKNSSIQKSRRKFVVKQINLISGISLLIIVGAIWGLNQNKIALFLGSILVVSGVAFFAQWSLLSNITAGLILFFHLPAKIGNRKNILDKDFPIDGEIVDMSYFFVKIKTYNIQIILIPNSLLIKNLYH